MEQYTQEELNENYDRTLKILADNIHAYKFYPGANKIQGRAALYKALEAHNKARKAKGWKALSLGKIHVLDLSFYVFFM